MLRIVCQRLTVKNVHRNIPKAKMTYSECLFQLISTVKPKNIQFAVMQDKEKQQILTFQKRKASLFLPFALKKVIILALKVVMLGWMCVICVITDVQINFNEASFLSTLAFYSHIVKGIKPAMLNQIEAHHPANSINDTTYKTPTSS